jgi:hypothetical protein
MIRIERGQHDPARRRIHRPHSLDDELLARVNVKAYMKAIGPKDEALEQIVTRLSLEAGVTAISWEVAAAVDAEDASITTSEEVIRAA